MVRFIIYIYNSLDILYISFTFQYGQIYYDNQLSQQIVDIKIYIPIWLDLLCDCQLYFKRLRKAFTFQYGQIYYPIYICYLTYYIYIYIPIWLDLLCRPRLDCFGLVLSFTFQYGQIYYPSAQTVNALLSKFTFQYGQIYYFFYCYSLIQCDNDLHSNMVRFIIYVVSFVSFVSTIFTFQYGQIYYSVNIVFLSCINQIYIPIWLDLLLHY